MGNGGAAEFIAECFWPGVKDADLKALDERGTRAAQAISSAAAPVRYHGSLLMREDEVVLVLFSGEPAAIRKAAEAANVPFERLVKAARSPWPSTEG